MATDSAVNITAGTGTPVDGALLAGGDFQQVVREARATAVTLNTWTVSTTASTSQIAADFGRVCVLIVSNASARVYLHFGATAPTASAYNYHLDPGDRWEVPAEWSILAVSMLGASAGGTILSTLGTAA